MSAHNASEAVVAALEAAAAAYATTKQPRAMRRGCLRKYRTRWWGWCASCAVAAVRSETGPAGDAYAGALDGGYGDAVNAALAVAYLPHPIDRAALLAWLGGLPAPEYADHPAHHAPTRGVRFGRAVVDPGVIVTALPFAAAAADGDVFAGWGYAAKAAVIVLRGAAWVWCGATLDAGVGGRWQGEVVGEAFVVDGAPWTGGA